MPVEAEIAVAVVVLVVAVAAARDVAPAVADRTAAVADADKA